MAWLRIDDRVRTHPKIAQAGPPAAWLWFCGICYCREHLTDGFIPRVILPGLALNLTHPEKHAKRLVEVNLWHNIEGGYQVHDFLDWNPSRAEVEAGREAEKDRKRKERGHRPESDVCPPGQPSESSHAHAGALARATVKASGSEKEETSRQPIHERVRPDRMNPGGVVPLLDRQFSEFVSRVSPEYPDRSDAYAAVLAWMHTVDDATRARGKSVGGDPFKWWQARLDEWKPTPTNGKRAEQVPEYRTDAAEPCRHVPPCTSGEMHRTALTLNRPEGVTT